MRQIRFYSNLKTRSKISATRQWAASHSKTLPDSHFLIKASRLHSPQSCMACNHQSILTRISTYTGTLVTKQVLDFLSSCIRLEALNPKACFKNSCHIWSLSLDNCIPSLSKACIIWAFMATWSDHLFHWLRDLALSALTMNIRCRSQAYQCSPIGRMWLSMRRDTGVWQSIWMIQVTLKLWMRFLTHS